MTFSNFGLVPGLLGAIRKAGYQDPTPVQTAAIPKILKGQDVIAIAQTGTGKTAAYVLPLLHRLVTEPTSSGRPAVRVLILAPTRELAVQIMENIRNYGQSLPIRTAAIFGGVDERAQIRALQRGVHIIVATPGRLLDLLGRHRIPFDGLDCLVLDEADRMLDMGFLPNIETIIASLPKRRQTLMLSATFPKEVESLARRFLHQPKLVQIGGRSNPADTVRQSVYQVPAHLKESLLLALLAQDGFDKVLVFVRMKDGANRLTTFLRESGVNAARLHSSRTQEQRLRVLQDFKEGNIRVLVATDIVARGIDIDAITHVVNFDFPVNPDDYIHRIGRTGRAEHSGEAISLVPERDNNLLGILEFTIGKRLPKRKLKGFNYHAPVPPRSNSEPQPRRDWRKRTRQMEAKRMEQATKPEKGKPQIQG